MAKLKENKTIEQRLEEALILYDAVPYKLSDNWCWVHIAHIAELGMGQTVLSKELKPFGSPIYSATADNKVFGYIDKTDNKINLSFGDMVIAARGTIGSIKLVEVDNASCTQTTMYMKPYSKECYKYLYYVLVSFSEKLFVPTGATIPQLTIRSLQDKMIPLAPLEEQKRIVEKIDNLFSKLDGAKELIQKSLDSFADRKSAILHEAFTGELLNKKFDIFKELKDLTSIITDGTHQTPHYVEQGGYIFLSSKNVKTGKIDWENIKFIPQELHEQLYSRLAPKLDDILLAKNGTTGIAAIVDRDCIFDIYVSLALIRPLKNIINPRYLWYMINSPDTKRYFDSSLKGIGVPNLHLQYINKTLIPIVPFEEQEEIVRILDAFFEKEDKSKELLDMLDKIDEMKKSILARAFRGELGTNDPNDEPAIEFLKSIL